MEIFLVISFFHLKNYMESERTGKSNTMIETQYSK